MWIRNGGLLAAVLALLAISIVSFGAWFTLTHGDVCGVFFDSCTRSIVGLLTLVIVLTAGGLMAYAFAQAEESVVLYRERSSEDAEGGSAGD